MKKTLYLFGLLVMLVSFKGSEEYFTGKLVYDFQFTDLSGNDISDKLTPYFGKEQHYFINNRHYKAYDESNNLVQLYHSNSNTYYSVSKDKTAKQIEGSMLTSQKHIVKYLTVSEKIAGYECKAIQVETDHGSVIYYYSPMIKVDPQVFAKHNFGEWNKYLDATKGALALKYILKNPQRGYVMTATVTEVEKLPLLEKDFELPADIQIK